MSMPTAKQWQAWQRAAEQWLGTTELQCDGYRIRTYRQEVKRNQLGLVLYVNGQIKGIWCDARQPCPEQRFLRKRERYIFKAADRKMLKALSKTKKKELRRSSPLVDNPDAKVIWFDVIWPSAKALRRHLEQVCESIEIVEPVCA